MFHEYALDPAILNSWPTFRYLTDQFGMSQGRLISRYPKAWKRAVYDSAESASTIEKQRIVEGLARIDSKLYAPGRNHDTAKTWLENACSSHQSHPFRAIITSKTSFGLAGTVDHEDLNDEHGDWVPGIDPVPRQAAEMARAAEMLLKCSRKVAFVDQYFGWAGRHVRPLKAFIQAASQGASLQSIEYHLGTVKSGTAEWFKEQLENHITQLALPRGVSMTFYRWKEIDAGEQLHPRYILTELGGMSFEAGLDDAGDRDSSQTTDVTSLPIPTYKARKAEYSENSATFQLEDSWVVLDGTVEKTQTKSSDPT
jgi:hypothetical protein